MTPHRVTVALAAPLWASATLVARSLGLSLSWFVTGLIEAGVADHASSAGGETLEGGEAPQPSARPRGGRLGAVVVKSAGRPPAGEVDRSQ
jgi:hypothetical protein